MKSLIFAILFLLASASTAFAQHPCDIVQPTSGTALAGATATLQACHPGTDANGNLLTGWNVYVNNGAPTALIMTKSATAGTSGLFNFTATITVPATVGVYTYETTALSGATESGRSNPFALTVSLPRVAPIAPTKSRVQ